ncbi:acyltransferase [Leptothoe spongobia]|uniref:Acyltransferase n=1 Tax=Leptothoe spongobia TAU-MAC 1115 TaxID=1967444 RepID=A0A947GFZ0_9CYAN|nr:acyltransferase [Leptothoe spongobia]MBT9314590.1 acyltransferase [Leptothoe spongobia TAU-MAC 1115]
MLKLIAQKCKLIIDFFLGFIEAFIRGNHSELAVCLRRIVYKTECFIDTNVLITNKNNFKSGNKSCLYHACYILNTHGTFSIGDNSHLAAFCYVNVCHGTVSIGNDVAIGPGTKVIAYSNHYNFGKKVTEERVIKNIVIKNNVFIGANCTILPGSIINENVVVGAGAIIKGALEANSIYAGVPCKKIKSSWYE